MIPSDVRDQFPIFAQSVNGQPLAYLDNSATTQKPASVIDAITAFYRHDNANVHRGIHTLSERATTAYDHARESIATFIGAGSPQELVFTRGTTETINLVAASYLAPRLKPGHSVMTTVMEHHSNFVPWQQLCKQAGAELRVVPITAGGELNLETLGRMLDSSVQLVSVVHVSNVLGTINPIAEIVKHAKAINIPVLVDGAQSIAHLPVDVNALGIDFFAFSGHKMYGPTGIGGLWAKREHLEAMRPYQFGGDMIASVSIEQTTWNELPYKFEAGTPNIAGTIGLGAAVEFLRSLGMDNIRAHEREVLTYLCQQLSTLPALNVLGPTDLDRRSGLCAFSIEGIHPHDVASIADEHGVAIRAGFHCAEPLHRSLGLAGSARASLGIYTTKAEIDQLVEALTEVVAILGEPHGA